MSRIAKGVIAVAMVGGLSAGVAVPSLASSMSKDAVADHAKDAVVDHATARRAHALKDAVRDTSKDAVVDHLKDAVADKAQMVDWQVVAGDFSTRVRAMVRVQRLDRAGFEGFSIERDGMRLEVERTVRGLSTATAEISKLDASGFHARLEPGSK